MTHDEGTLRIAAKITIWKNEHEDRIVASIHALRDRREYDLGDYPTMAEATEAVNHWARGRHLVLEDDSRVKYDGLPVMLKAYTVEAP